MPPRSFSTTFSQIVGVRRRLSAGLILERQAAGLQRVAVAGDAVFLNERVIVAAAGCRSGSAGAESLGLWSCGC